MEKIILKLYILNGFSTSKQAEKDMLELTNRLPDDSVEFEIIDLHKSPERAAEHKILATPTLVRVSPLPVKKVVGSFSNKDKVLRELNIDNTIEEEK